ncbi:MAG TPA: outer membrane lipoprotein carrier protein LolA [Thermoanaerobaculia bacterium]|nr:outer membrane lipoprotein carrier protein LolA [Thermoanaerobaculia bacterium]
MRRLLVLGFLLGFLLALPAAAQDPWGTLEGVRRSLAAAGPTGANFVQVYVPSGFTSGERESGQLAFALPDCLRWDYLDPFPKSFLLCGGVAHQWNPEDGTGQRFEVDRKNEPGLDLLLLSVADLRGRYRAASRPGEGGVAVTLTPIRPLEQLAEATFVVDPAKQRIVELSYRDREGNRTRFEIGGYRTLPRRGQFTPPKNVRWEEP